MGVQAVFHTASFERAGCVVIHHTLRHPDTSDYEGGGPEWEERWSTVIFPTGEHHNFHRAHDGALWVDFNHWGGNRPILEPLLAAHKVDYKLV